MLVAIGLSVRTMGICHTKLLSLSFPSLIVVVTVSYIVVVLATAFVIVIAVVIVIVIVIVVIVIVIAVVSWPEQQQSRKSHKPTK